MAWAAKDVFNPGRRRPRREGPPARPGRRRRSAAIAGTSRIGLAVSDDGHPLRASPSSRCSFPDDRPLASRWEWPGGCEDPRVVESPDGGFVCHLHGLRRQGGHASSWRPRTTSATGRSTGPPSHRRPYALRSSKSGSIVTEVERRPPRGGTHWTADSGCTGARERASPPRPTTSSDWTPIDFDATRDRYLSYDPSADRPWDVHVVPGQRALRPILFPRRRRFDSLFVEPGPPALSVTDGIVLIYNGANHYVDGDPALAATLLPARSGAVRRRRPCVVHRPRRRALPAGRRRRCAGGSGVERVLRPVAGAVRGPVASVFRHGRLADRMRSCARPPRLTDGGGIREPSPWPGGGNHLREVADTAMNTSYRPKVDPPFKWMT